MNLNITTTTNTESIKFICAQLLAAITRTNPMRMRGVMGMHGEEISAWLGLDETKTFKALDRLTRAGLVKFDSSGQEFGCAGYNYTGTGAVVAVTTNWPHRVR